MITSFFTGVVVAIPTSLVVMKLLNSSLFISNTELKEANARISLIINNLDDFREERMKDKMERLGITDKIQEAMLHTNLKGEINWKDSDDIEIQIAGTFAKDKFIVIKNTSKNPWVPAEPHPRYDYEKREWKKDEGI